MPLTPPPGFTPDEPATKTRKSTTSAPARQQRKRVQREEIADLADELGIPYAIAERQFLDAGYAIQ